MKCIQDIIKIDNIYATYFWKKYKIYAQYRPLGPSIGPPIGPPSAPRPFYSNPYNFLGCNDYLACSIAEKAERLWRHR